MFAARGIAVSFAIFFIFYGVFSAGVCLVWQKVGRYRERWSARSYADVLFSLRMMPGAVAVGVTLGLAVPSFWLLEPRAVQESIGGAAVGLSICGAAVLLAGIWNASAALVRASRTVARWSGGPGGGDRRDADFETPVLRMRAPAGAPLTAAGILRPRVWLSNAAEFVLTERELESALRHELVHVRRRDNLRKLVLRLVASPGMKQLERAWHEATEMAADDAAVSNASEALDLAAAVIKLSRLAPLAPAAELTTALVHSPAESVNARVERLIAWSERRKSVAPGYALRYSLCAAAAAMAMLVVTYGTLLMRVHAATEWLVR